ncbi:efflux RND transporter permease subunit [Limimaricola pyoseonensis]|uniref:Multidrug efflux pump subunit AcrB n=1 Tax=Limimaricola pyoseonensis TaxID=521013 RepID=A0A1G7FSY4_9RHOB|nr:efflux RND transporter permease subunit [Limimaricola pyoseonensis]SDE79033.1 Multidrug efflux pump subunit AcrB [Limimaricola pyoseonensis]
MRLVAFFTRHPTAANLLMVLITVFGVYAATQIRAQYLPDVVFERVDVSIPWDDASAEDVQDGIVAVASPSLLAVEGLSELSAVAREGGARFSLEFEPGWDIGRAMEDVEAALPSAASLPEAAETPAVSRAAWRDRVFDLVLAGDLPRDRLEELGEALQQELLRAGLTRVSLRGTTAPELSVTLSAARLAEHGLSLQQVADAIAQGARDSAAGETATGGVPVRVGQDRLSDDALAGLSLATATGRVTLGEIAAFERVEAGSGRAYFLEGVPAVVIGVERGEGGDALKIREAALDTARAFAARQSEPLEVAPMRDNASRIADRLAILADNAAFGLLLVLALLFVFLSPSAAIWVAGGIPVALAAGLGLLWLTGQSLNMISIFALLICLGIIVDDAIVVAESAEARHRQNGESRARAAERAARRMLGPILASTATTVVAFMSLMAVGGRFGDFMAAIPFTVAAVLLASLAECFLVLPHHLGHGFARLDRSWLAWPARAVNRGFDRMRAQLVAPLLRGLMSLRYAVLLVAVGATLQALLMVIERDVAWRFFVAPQQPMITANIAMRDDATRADTEAMLDELLRASNEVRADFAERHGADPVVTVLTEIGGGAGRGLASAEDKDADLLGAVTIELIEADDRPYATDAFVTAFEAALDRPPLLETFSFRAGRFGPGGDGLDIALYGDDPARLDAAAAALQAVLSQIPEITGLEDDLTLAGTAQSLRLNGYGEALGFTEAAIAAELRARLQGVEATTWQEGAQTGRIEVRLPEGALGAAYLDEILLPSPEGRWVTLAEIVTLEPSPALGTIRSTAGQAVVRVTGEISTEDPDLAETLLERIETVELPRIAAAFGTGYALQGLAAQEAQFLSDAAIGFGVCLLMIYMVLALVLGHWVRPLSIMAVIPVGVTGVVWGHYWWDMPLSIFSAVGFIGLSGIIVNDSIVLITAIDERMRRVEPRAAIIGAVSERLRPVLLTTLTTVLGLAPLLFETSTQAEFLKPMVLTLCSGLVFGFAIVLLVVPALVAIQLDLAAAWRRVAGRRPARDRMA